MRVVLLTGGDSKCFCSGIDLQFLQSMGGESISEAADTARKHIAMTKGLKFMQGCFDAISDCSKPVVGLADRLCIGAGLEL